MDFKKSVYIKLGAALAAAVLAFPAMGCKPGAAAPAMAQGGAPGGPGGPGGMQQKSSAITVNIAYPERETLSRRTQFAGRLEPSQTVKVYPEVAGTVAATYANVGDYVEKGALLFEFDTEDAELALQKAELAYQKTMNDLASDESGSGKALEELSFQSAITSAQNSYESARDSLEVATGEEFDFAQFRRARKKLKESLKAWEENETTETYSAYVAAEDDYYDLLDEYTDYDKYKQLITSFENSYDNYMKALDQYEIYKSMTTGEEAANRDISRTQAELTLADAQKALVNQRVYAPVSGIISAKNINEYDAASTQTVAYTISQEGIPAVSFNVSEDGANAMDIGTEVSVEYNGREYPAVVTELAPEASASTGLYATKAQLTEDIGTTRSGSVIKVMALTALEQNTLTVPLDNIYYDGNQPYVYVYKDGVARRTDVVIGMTTTDKVSIVEGLNDGDAVISTWHPRLEDGAAVYNSSLDGAQAAPAN